MPGVRDVLYRLRTFCERVEEGAWTGATGRRITDVVNIGIGGSDLGPRLVCEALMPFRQGRARVHFVANLDGSDLAQTLRDLEPETTLFVICLINYKLTIVNHGLIGRISLLRLIG